MVSFEMPKAILNIHGLKLDKNRLTKTVDRQLQIANRKAARSWLRAVFIRVPVWTGMARGSLKFADGPDGNLAAFLNVAIPIVPKVKTTYKKDEMTQPGKYNFTSARKVYQFFFRSRVLHYSLNEFFARTDGANEQITAPWQSFQYGRAAYRQTMTEEIAKLPQVKSFIFRDDVSF